MPMKPNTFNILQLYWRWNEDASVFFSIYFQVRLVFLYIIITGFKLWSIYRTVTCRHMWVEVWEIIITVFTCFIFDSQYMFVIHFHSLAVICWTFLRHFPLLKTTQIWVTVLCVELDQSTVIFQKCGGWGVYKNETNLKITVSPAYYFDETLLCLEWQFNVPIQILYSHLLLKYTCPTFPCWHAAAVSCCAGHIFI